MEGFDGSACKVGAKDGTMEGYGYASLSVAALAVAMRQQHATSTTNAPAVSVVMVLTHEQCQRPVGLRDRTVSILFCCSLSART